LNPPFQGSENTVDEEAESVRTKGNGKHTHTHTRAHTHTHTHTHKGYLNQHDQSSLELTETEAVCAESVRSTA